MVTGYRWEQCDECSEEYYYGNRISSGWKRNEDGTSDKCPKCFGRRGFWTDPDTGFHDYYHNDPIADEDELSVKNNKREDDDE
jgi:hypothetical protein